MTTPLVAAGQTIGQYEIVSKLGSGGMGDVFLGRDTRLDRKVAIKMLPREFSHDSERLRRFELEARALAALSHPNIVSVFSVEEHAGLHLLVMEFVEGRTLRELIPPRAWPRAISSTSPSAWRMRSTRRTRAA